MKLTLGKKLGFGVGTILALMVISSVLTYLKAASIKETQDHAMAVRVPTIGALKDLQRDLNQAQSKGRQVILAGDQPDRREAAQKVFDSNWNDIEKDVSRLDEVAPRWTLQSNRDRLADTRNQLPNLRRVQETAMKHATGGERDAVAKAGNEFADQATVMTEALKKPLGEMAESFSTLLQKSQGELASETRTTAVEEQSATTSEMSRNVSEAARGATTISSNIQGVADAAQDTSTNVGHAQTATDDLTRMANQLRDLVGNYEVGNESAMSNAKGPGADRSAKAVGRAAGAP